MDDLGITPPEAVSEPAQPAMDVMEPGSLNEVFTG
jgi:hypothetical protein